jgi:ClpX C4-type zinc finger
MRCQKDFVVSLEKRQDALSHLSDIVVEEKIQRKASSNECSQPRLSGEYRFKRLVAGVSGYICDECVTKCVAVLEQHGGFPPTVPGFWSTTG